MNGKDRRNLPKIRSLLKRNKQNEAEKAAIKMEVDLVRKVHNGERHRVLDDMAKETNPARLSAIVKAIPIIAGDLLTDEIGHLAKGGPAIRNALYDSIDKMDSWAQSATIKYMAAETDPSFFRPIKNIPITAGVMTEKQAASISKIIANKLQEAQAKKAPKAL